MIILNRTDENTKNMHKDVWLPSIAGQLVLFAGIIIIVY